jgi:hypothetical protein
MSSSSGKFHPQGGDVQALHDARFDIFEKFQTVARHAAGKF